MLQSVWEASLELFPHFATLEPYSKINEIPFFPQKAKVCFVSREHDTRVCEYSHEFSMKCKTEPSCCPPIFLEMFLQLDWSSSAVNSVEWTGFKKAHGCLFKVPQLTVHVRAQTRREVKRNCL